MGDQNIANSNFRIEVTKRIPVGKKGDEVLFYSRHRLREERPRLVRERDIRTAVLILTNLAVSILVPRRYWPQWIKFVAGIRLGKHMRKEFAPFAASVAAVLGELDEGTLRKLFGTVYETRHKRLMQLCAELSRLRWEPAIELVGADGLGKALERGNGAIIWCNQLFSQNLLGKRALHQAGIAPHQVSVSEHGFWGSAMARIFLNPLTVHAENRYLKERVVFERGDAIQVTRRIASILKENGVVLLTHNTYSGSSFAQTPFGLDGYLQSPTTPVNFAVKNGAALFTMTTYETEPFARYEAVISPEIRLSGAEGTMHRSKAAAWSVMADALLQANRRMFADVQRAPEQFIQWAEQAESIERYQVRDGQGQATACVDHASSVPGSGSPEASGTLESI